MGAKIVRFCPATGIEPREWRMDRHTPKGDIRCEYVVNAAGYYAQRVGEWFKPYGGRTVPMMVMSHQYMLFEERAGRAKAWSDDR
jgi:dimethylglycine dehydrogenase